nr:immunoglobulin heavy chain junction region [Mus musculus]
TATYYCARIAFYYVSSY